MQGLEKHGFLKRSTHWVLRFYWDLDFIGFQIFYLNEQLESLLVDLAHQLSFYLDLQVLKIYTKIRKFITYWPLEAVNKEIFKILLARQTEIELYLVWVFAGVFNGFYTSTPDGFLDIIRVSVPWQNVTWGLYSF